MIYFVHGPDRLLARRAATAIVKDVDPDGHNTSWLDGRETSFSKLSAAIGSVSFFGSTRTVVVSDLLPRTSRDLERDTDVAEASTGALSDLQDILKRVPQSHCLILLEPSLLALPASLKASLLAIEVISGAPPRGAELVRWIQERAVELGSSISPRSAQYLATLLYPQTWDRRPNNPRFDEPPDMMLISNEVEKLATAAFPGEIADDLIRELTPGRPDQRLFRFIDAALARNLRPCLLELQRLEVGGEEPAQLLAQVLGQVELTTVATYVGQRSADDVARDLGTVQPGRMSAVMSASRSRDRRGIVSTGEAIEADRKLKSGRSRLPSDALYDLILTDADSKPD
jgi:DNA polymerase III delta subunit